MNRISLKIGTLEIQYEGDQLFIEQKLIGFIREISELSPIAQPLSSQAASGGSSDGQSIDISTNTIAQITDTRTGSDLVMAAIARLVISKKQASATRQEILSEMKEATTYYKETFASNLSSYLDTLVKSRRINMVSRQTYSLPAGEKARLEDVIKSQV